MARPFTYVDHSVDVRVPRPSPWRLALYAEAIRDAGDQHPNIIWLVVAPDADRDCIRVSYTIAVVNG